MLVSRSVIKERRADKVVDDTPVEGNLIKIKKPEHITLVGLPAVQTGFKIQRSAKGETPMSTATLIRRTRRSDTPNPVLRLTFPEGADEAFVTGAMKEFGLHNYTVTEDAGVFTAMRADLKSISESDTMQIKLNDEGLMATVARADAPQTEKSAIAITSIEFDVTKFTSEEIQRWVDEKGVDGTIHQPQNSDKSCVVRRSEVPDGEEVRNLVLEDGVTAVIIRSDVMNVPAGFVAVVNEAAYGSWGWGQLDFAAAMADKAFSSAMEDSIYRIKEVMLNIVLYSALPLDVRKELANRALGQFGDYIGTILDSLPRQLLASVVRSAANTQPEKEMTKANEGGTTPEATVVNNAAAPAAPVAAALSRDDINAMIQDGIKQGIEAFRASQTPEAIAAAAAAAEAAEAAKPVTRSDMSKLVEDAVKPLADQLAKVTGQTVVRSANDGEQTPVAPVAEKKNASEMFRGAFKFPAHPRSRKTA